MQYSTGMFSFLTKRSRFVICKFAFTDSILDGYIYCFIDVEKYTLEYFDYNLFGEPEEIGK